MPSKTILPPKTILPRRAHRIHLAVGAPTGQRGSSNTPVTSQSAGWLAGADREGLGLRNHVCCSLGITDELWHRRMQVCEPDIQPDGVVPRAFGLRQCP